MNCVTSQTQRVDDRAQTPQENHRWHSREKIVPSLRQEPQSLAIAWHLVAHELAVVNFISHDG